MNIDYGVGVKEEPHREGRCTPTYSYSLNYSVMSWVINHSCVGVCVRAREPKTVTLIFKLRMKIRPRSRGTSYKIIPANGSLVITFQIESLTNAAVVRAAGLFCWLREGAITPYLRKANFTECAIRRI